ncbi:C40 family peptidase [Mesobacillus zeae]|nr:C40 family peptidase [Mesobacillus zeae]
MSNTTNGTTKAVNIEVGKDVRLYVDGDEIFRGVIFNTEIASDGSFSFTAYDYNYYLTKNMDSMKFVKQKASQIIRTICSKYGISAGTIDDTGYVIPKLILRDKTLYDMIMIALTETRKKTGKVFMLGNEKGKLVLRERKSQVKRLIIKDGSNLLSASYSESIEDLRNSVRITGKSGEESKGVTVSDSASTKKYGLMREKEHESEKSVAQLMPIANALLKELNKVARESNIDALGEKSIISGKMVQVSEKMTGISGGFYVITDSHTFEPNGLHSMSITVSKTLELNELEYEPPEEPEKTMASGGASNDKATDVVNLARSFKGKVRYVFGGKSIANGTGDCSGFTYYVFKKATGKDIGHGTSAQIRKGKQVSKASAQAGDLVFFQGTYRSGVSHVGIVTRPGFCVSLASSGCQEHSYTTGYWAGHYMEIRRVI